MARLKVVRPEGEDAYPGPIRFEVCYGGVAIASSTLPAGSHDLTVELPGLADWMEDRGLTVRAWSDHGPMTVRATCVRGTYQPTAAEAKARVRWPSVRGRGADADPGTALIESVQTARAASRSRSTKQVVVYETTERVLDRRRARMARGRRALRPGSGVSAGAPASP